MSPPVVKQLANRPQNMLDEPKIVAEKLRLMTFSFVQPFVDHTVRGYLIPSPPLSRRRAQLLWTLPKCWFRGLMTTARRM